MLIHMDLNALLNWGIDLLIKAYSLATLLLNFNLMVNKRVFF